MFYLLKNRKKDIDPVRKQRVVWHLSPVSALFLERKDAPPPRSTLVLVRMVGRVVFGEKEFVCYSSILYLI